MGLHIIQCVICKGHTEYRVYREYDVNVLGLIGSTAASKLQQRQWNGGDTNGKQLEYQWQQLPQQWMVDSGAIGHK